MRFPNPCHILIKQHYPIQRTSVFLVNAVSAFIKDFPSH